jgi:hypothetical protein
MYVIINIFVIVTNVRKHQSQPETRQRPSRDPPKTNVFLVYKIKNYARDTPKRGLKLLAIKYN